MMLDDVPFVVTTYLILAIIHWQKTAITLSLRGSGYIRITH